VEEGNVIQVYKSDEMKQRMLHSYDEILAGWTVGYRETDIDTTYGSTHCIISGSPGNPPLLMFHGVGDNSAMMWMLNMPELASHLYCVAVDTLGGPGKSVPNQRYKDTFDQVEWIEQVSDGLGFHRPSLLGVSNGAYMAFNYTVERPGKVSRAVCIEGGMVVKPLLTMLRTLGILFPEILIPTDQNMVRIMRKLSSPDSDLFDRYPQVVEHMVLAMRSHNRGAMFRHKLQKYDEGKALLVKDKLHFILGGYRIEGKREFTDLLAHGGFSYSIIPHAGHAANHEQPEQTDAAILAFLLGSPPVRGDAPPT
jgi:pimeloyl-ACP methyl ester carboxylesterase